MRVALVLMAVLLAGSTSALFACPLLEDCGQAPSEENCSAGRCERISCSIVYPPIFTVSGTPAGPEQPGYSSDRPFAVLSVLPVPALAGRMVEDASPGEPEKLFLRVRVLRI